MTFTPEKLLIAVIAVCAWIRCVQAECCVADLYSLSYREIVWAYDSAEACGSMGACNFFCCNCDGGCKDAPFTNRQTCLQKADEHHNRCRIQLHQAQSQDFYDRLSEQCDGVCKTNQDLCYDNCPTGTMGTENCNNVKLKVVKRDKIGEYTIPSNDTSYCAAMGEMEVFTKVDVDRSFTVDFEEAINYVNHTLGGVLAYDSALYKIWTLRFQEFDKNGDGTLNAWEVRRPSTNSSGSA